MCVLQCSAITLVLQYDGTCRVRLVFIPTMDAYSTLHTSASKADLCFIVYIIGRNSMFQFKLYKRKDSVAVD